MRNLVYVLKLSRCALADVTKQPNNIPRSETYRNQVLLLQIINRDNTETVSSLSFLWDKFYISNTAWDGKTSLLTSPGRLETFIYFNTAAKVFVVFVYKRVQCAMNFFYRIQV